MAYILDTECMKIIETENYRKLVSAQGAPPDPSMAPPAAPPAPPKKKPKRKPLEFPINFDNSSKTPTRDDALNPIDRA
jgi:hypothetical protein